jgi:hypothetical protein
MPSKIEKPYTSLVYVRQPKISPLYDVIVTYLVGRGDTIACLIWVRQF